MEKSTTEKTEWPTIEEQQAYWRTKEADISLDKVEATTDYYDHFSDGNTDSDRPFPANETDLSAVPVLAEPPNVAFPRLADGVSAGSEALESTERVPTSADVHDVGPAQVKLADSRGGAQNFHLSIEAGKGSSASTLAEQETSVWAEPAWTLRDEVGESYKEIP